MSVVDHGSTYYCDMCGMHTEWKELWRFTVKRANDCSGSDYKAEMKFDVCFKCVPDVPYEWGTDPNLPTSVGVGLCRKLADEMRKIFSRTVSRW